MSLVKYRVKNVKNTGETLGKILYTSDEGAPGITIGISRKKSEIWIYYCETSI